MDLSNHLAEPREAIPLVPAPSLLARSAEWLARRASCDEVHLTDSIGEAAIVEVRTELHLLEVQSWTIVLQARECVLVHITGPDTLSASLLEAEEHPPGAYEKFNCLHGHTFCAFRAFRQVTNASPGKTPFMIKATISSSGRGQSAETISYAH